MDFASGGLSDEQRKGDLAKGGIVSPQTWRVLDAGPGDGCYIPQNTKRHSVELLLKTAKAMGFGGENGDV